MLIFRAPQVILFSEDLPRTAEFYTALGFTETFRVPAEGPPIHVDRGAPAMAEPHVWLSRLLIAWTADPDGNPVQIVQSL